MDLGQFSLSLPVSDLARSRAFYETLGFRVAGGDPEQGWLILRNPRCVIGLFQNMFEQPILTFNPGWGSDATPLENFEDVRAIQARLQQAGLAIETEADPDGSGPAHCLLRDPDGNPILIDQHV